MTTRLSSLDPYNLRLTGEPERCISGVEAPAGLIGYCHETPLSDGVLLEQAPCLAVVLFYLQESRNLAMADDKRLANLVRSFATFAERNLGPLRPSPYGDFLGGIEESSDA